jgi:hypothetical protein
MDVPIQPGEIVEREIALTRLRVDLMLKLNPTYTKAELFDEAGARVLSDQGRGLVLKSLPAGNYRLELTADGWKPIERMLSLMERENEFQFQLKRETRPRPKQERAAPAVSADRGIFTISARNIPASAFPIRIGGLVIDGAVATDSFKDRSGNVWLRKQADDVSTELWPGEHSLDALAVSIAGNNHTLSKSRSFFIRGGHTTNLMLSLDKRKRLLIEFSEN